MFILHEDQVGVKGRSHFTFILCVVNLERNLCVVRTPYNYLCQQVGNAIHISSKGTHSLLFRGESHKKFLSNYFLRTFNNLINTANKQDTNFTAVSSTFTLYCNPAKLNRKKKTQKTLQACSDFTHVKSQERAGTRSREQRTRKCRRPAKISALAQSSSSAINFPNLLTR